MGERKEKDPLSVLLRVIIRSGQLSKGDFSVQDRTGKSTFHFRRVSPVKQEKKLLKSNYSQQMSSPKIGKKYRINCLKLIMP